MPQSPRLAARALLVDEYSRILLLQGHDSTVPMSRHWWFTVGGGIRSEETPEVALRREVFEETGKLLHSFSPTPFSQVFTFTFEGREHSQSETYYRANVASFEPHPKRLTPVERRSIIGHRWWTLADLKTTHETIYPAELPSWLELLLR